MKKNLLNSFVTGVITSSLVFSPTAFAKVVDPNANPKVEEFKNAINETKLESVNSYSDLWQRIQKSNISPNQLENFRNLISTMNGQKFPEMKFQDFKYKGKSAIRLITNVQGEQIVVEYLFSNNEAIKINGVILTNEDLDNKDKLNKKISNLGFIKKGYAAFKKNIFSKSFVPDFNTWNKLTNHQKAEYLLKFRQLLEASYNVFDKSSFKVIVKQDNNRILQELLKSLMIGEESYAQSEIGTKKAKITPAQQSATLKTATTPNEAKNNVSEVMDQIKSAPFLAEGEGDGKRKSPSCIVAAYAIDWKGNACPWNGNGDFYKKNPTSQECLKSKGNGYIACNPLVYGFDDSGSPFCINTKDKDFQIATHGSGPCEKVSPINDIDQKKLFIERWLKKVKIDSDVVKEKKADGTFGLFTKNQKLYNAFTEEIQKPLKNYIDSAFKVCSASGSDGVEKDVTSENAESTMKFKYKESYKPPKGKKPPKGDPAKQDDACDALLKRAISVKQLLEPVTDSGTVISSSDCKDWTPAGSAIKHSEGDCVCDEKNGWSYDSQNTNKKTCKKIDLKPPVVAGVDTDEAGNGLSDNKCSSSNPGYWQRITSPIACSASPWDFGMLFAGFALIDCVLGATKNKNTGLTRSFSFCNPDKKNAISTAPGHIDPVNPGLPTTTTTVTTTGTTGPINNPTSEPAIDTKQPDAATGSVR